MHGRVAAVPATRSLVPDAARDAPQDAEANSRLDAHLAGFLRLLSAYFLLPAATRTLEFLIRRFKCASIHVAALMWPDSARRVHVYNVDSAVTCALPYHGTPQFIRLLQVLQLEDSRWAFLSGAKAEGAAPTREALTANVARNSGLLALVCDAALASASGSARGTPGVSAAFYALLCTEALGGMARVPLDVLPRLLPYIEAGFAAGASADHRAGALMLSAQLAARAQLSPVLCDALLEGMAKSAAQPPLEVHALQAMLQLTRTHAMAVLPRRAITFLVKVPELARLLAHLSRSFAADALLRPLLAALVAHLGTHSTYRKTLLSIIQDVPLQTLAAQLVADLLAAAAAVPPAGQSDTAQMAVREAAVCALQALLPRCPAEVEAAVAALVRKGASKGAKESASSPMLDVVREAFSRTVAQPLAGSSGVTLAAGLDSPKACVRESALKQLKQLLQPPDGVDAAEEGTAMPLAPLCDVVLRRVADADSAVAAAALALPRLADIVPDEAALFKAAAATFLRAAVALRAGGAAADLKAGKRALTLLASLGERNALLADAAACLLLGCLVDDAGLQSVAPTARRLAVSSSHALFSCAAAPVGGVADEELGAQHAALSALGDGISADGAMLQWVLAQWGSLGAHGQHALLLALLSALSACTDAGLCAQLSDASWQLLQRAPLTALPAGADTGAWAAGLPPKAHLELSATNLEAARSAVQQRLLAVALQHLPATAADAICASLGHLGRVFALLARTAAPPPGVLDTLLERAAAVFGSRNKFLALLAAADPARVDKAAPAAALRMLTRPLDSALVPFVLVALAHPKRAVRDAALDTLAAAAKPPPSSRTPSRSVAASRSADAASACLAAWVAAHREGLLAGGALTLLLREALGDAALAPLRQLLLALFKSDDAPVYASTQLALLLLGSGDDGAAAVALAPAWARFVAGGDAAGTAFSRVMLDVFAAAAMSGGGEDAQTARSLLVGALDHSRPSATRAAVMDGLREQLYACFSAADQETVLSLLVVTSRRDTDAVCRAAARGALERIPVDGAVFAKLLASSCARIKGAAAAAAATPAKRARRDAAPAAAPLPAPDPELFEFTVSVLEVLQWRQLACPEALLGPASEALSCLLDAGAAAAQAGEASPAGEGEGEGAAAMLRPATEYRLQLALMTLTALVRASVSSPTLDVPLIVRALHQAPDANVRRAAIELLTAAATAAPDRVVEEALNITLSLTSQAVSTDDSEGARALHEAFAALAPCWVRGHGDSGAALLQHIVTALPRVPEHRRLPLLSALLHSLPSPEALTALLQQLLAAAAQSPASATSLLMLAAVLCSTRPTLECFQAWCSLLHRISARADGDASVVADFVAGELRTADISAWIRARAGEAELQACLSELTGNALALLKRGGGADADPRVRQSVQALLLAVEGLASPLHYLLAVARLFSHADRHVQRRALKLFASRVRDSREPASQAEADEASSLIATIAPLVRAADRAQASTRRAALEVLTVLVERYGPAEACAAALVPVLPDVLAAANEARPLVSASGFSCLAAAVLALSTRALPAVPSVVPAVLAALQRADVATEDGARPVLAALSALSALLLKLDSFLSPFLPQALALLLSPQLLGCGAPEVERAAAAARTLLAQRLPSRLLLEPMLAAWAGALPLGAGACVALLQQLRIVAERLDAGEAAAQSEAVFGAPPYPCLLSAANASR